MRQVLSYITNFFAYIISVLSFSSNSTLEERALVEYDGVTLGLFEVKQAQLITITAILDKYKQQYEQSLEEKLNTLLAENESLLHRLHSADEYTRFISSQFEADITILHDKISEAQTKLSQQQKEIEDREQTITRLQSDQSETHRDLENKIRVLQTQITESEIKSQQLVKEKQVASEECTRLREEVGSLKTNLNEIKETVEGVYNTIQKLVSEKEEAENSLYAAQADIERLIVEKKELESTINAHALEIMVLNKQLEYSRARSTLSNATSSCGSPTTSVTSISSRFTNSLHNSPQSNCSSPVSSRSYPNSLHNSPVSTPPLHDVSNSIYKSLTIKASPSPLNKSRVILTNAFEENITKSPSRKLHL
jgi:chromosome segregation ATPase